MTAIIFDYGNVLCLPQQRSDLDAMAVVLGVEPEAFDAIYWRYRLPYDRSDLDRESYWKQVARDAEREISSAQLDSLVTLDNQSWTHPDLVMTQWAESLRSDGMRTAILSNMPLPLREYLANCPWLPKVDHSTYSCDVRMTKPDPRIYQYCLEGLGVEAKEAVFLDDREENVMAARSLGIRSILFTGYAQAAAELLQNTKRDGNSPSLR
jgi:putative hydrolase of the HAD superfamily